MNSTEENTLEIKVPPGPKGLSLVRALPHLAQDPFGFCMNLTAQEDGLVRIGTGSKCNTSRSSHLARTQEVRS